MSLHEPSRGGTRGGKDQFTWKSVEVDKYRENYLANSLMAPVGRWQKGRDLTWYTKDSKVMGKKERLQMEVAAVKQAEEEAMARALGLKSGPIVKPTEKLSQEEIAEVCKRRDDDEEEVLQEERMKGVGFRSQRTSMTGISSAVAKDGVTKFEHDPSEDRRTNRLVLKTSSSGGHRRQTSVSVSSDQEPALPQKSYGPLSTNDEQEEWVVAERKEKKKKKKDKKKHLKKQKRQNHHSDTSDSEEKRWREKSEMKRVKNVKKRYGESSNESSDDDTPEAIKKTRRVGKEDNDCPSYKSYTDRHKERYKQENRRSLPGRDRERGDWNERKGHDERKRVRLDRSTRGRRSSSESPDRFRRRVRSPPVSYKHRKDRDRPYRRQSSRTDDTKRYISPMMKRGRSRSPKERIRRESQREGKQRHDTDSDEI